MDTEKNITEAAFNRAIQSAIYSHGSHLPADAWKSIACDMRDLARKFEQTVLESYLGEDFRAMVAGYEKKIEELDAACKDWIKIANKESERLDWLDRQISVDETKALFKREDVYTGDIRAAIDSEL